MGEKLGQKAQPKRLNGKTIHQFRYVRSERHARLKRRNILTSNYSLTTRRALRMYVPLIILRRIRLQKAYMVLRTVGQWVNIWMFSELGPVVPLPTVRTPFKFAKPAQISATRAKIGRAHV